MGGFGYLPYDGARISTESELGKKLLEWERKPGYDPAKNPFPKMLYRARHRPDGRRSVGEVLDSLFPVQGAAGPMVVAGAAEQWTRGCQLTVNDEQEMQRAMENGWRKTPQEALDYLEASDNRVTVATAERHYSDSRMGERAQAEAAEVDQSTLRQVPEITPEVREQAVARKRGRPRKAVSA